MIELHRERFFDQVSLEDIAERAGVTVQTVIRRFGSKERLIEAAAEEGTRQLLGSEIKLPLAMLRVLSRTSWTTTRSGETPRCGCWRRRSGLRRFAR